jgi:3-methyladenine DNA glycosylase AlkD
MNISDIRTRIESGADERSFLATKTAEPEQTPVLTLVDTAERTDVCDPLIQALVGKLPKPNSIWSLEDRAKWLRAAAMAFNLVYKADESGDADLKIEGKSSALKSAG